MNPSAKYVLPLLLLFLASCGLSTRGFQLADGNCQCQRSFYFLISSDSPKLQAGTELALQGKYVTANQEFASASAAGGDSECYTLNNLGLVRMLQGDSRGALKDLYEAHTLCPGDATIEDNLKNLLSRIPAS